MPPGWVTARTTLAITGSAASFLVEVWSAAMLPPPLATARAWAHRIAPRNLPLMCTPAFGAVGPGVITPQGVILPQSPPCSAEGRRPWDRRARHDYHDTSE